jgi:hypothetical protein
MELWPCRQSGLCLKFIYSPNWSSNKTNLFYWAPVVREAHSCPAHLAPLPTSWTATWTNRPTGWSCRTIASRRVWRLLQNICFYLNWILFLNLLKIVVSFVISTGALHANETAQSAIIVNLNLAIVKYDFSALNLWKKLNNNYAFIPIFNHLSNTRPCCYCMIKHI